MNRLYMLLTVMVVMVGAALLTLQEGLAQGLPGTTGTTPPTDESALCQNPQRVLQDVTETGNSFNTFRTTTNTFLVNYDWTGIDNVAPNSVAKIRVIDSDTQDQVKFVTLDADAADSFIVNAPPGTYDLEVDIHPQSAESVTYIVSVDQCRPTTTAPTDESALCQNPQRVLQDVTETGNSFNTFRTTTNVFLVNYDWTGIDNVAPNSVAKIRVIDSVTQDQVKFVTLDADAADSFIVNAPPGTYDLEVDIHPQSAESVTYIVSVDQCRPTTTAPTDESALCQNPQRVLQDVTETGNSFNTFRTTTNVFLVNYDWTGIDNVAPNSVAKIRVIDSVTQDQVKFVTLDADAADSFIVNAPPGTYDLEVDIHPQSAESVTYIVSVDQCRPTTTAPTDESALCQNPQRVLQDVTETGNSFNTFRTTTNVFLVNYDWTGIDNVAPNSVAKIRVIDSVTQDQVKFVTLDADAADSFIVNAPPGAYELEIDIDPQSAESVTYIVSVDQCGRTTTPPTDESALCQNPQRVLQDVTETGDSFNTFRTTTNVFLVNYDWTGTDNVAPNSVAKIRVIDSDTQDQVKFVTLDTDAADSFIVNAPSGAYELEIDIDPQSAEGVTYIVSVDQCRRTTTPPTDESALCQNPQR